MGMPPAVSSAPVVLPAFLWGDLSMTESEQIVDADNITRRIGARTHAKELIAFIDSEVAMEPEIEIKED